MNKKTIYYIVLIAIILTAGIVLGREIFKSRKSATPAPQNSSPSAAKSEDNTRVFFASNGKNSVYKIKKDSGWSVIWNGSEGKTYDFVSNPVFSSDGSQLAYAAEINGQHLVVVNNIQEINSYDGATDIVFNSDGTKIAFIAIKNDTYVVINTTVSSTPTETIENGDESEAYENIISVTFNEDGDLVYIVQEGDSVVTIVNGEVVSTIPADTYFQDEDSSDDSSDNDSDYQPPSSSTPSTRYRYNPSTTKDINTQADAPPCTGDCNF